MTPLPRPTRFDQTRSFVRDPYTFITATCERLGSDFFESRLFLKRTICLRGEDFAALFYDNDLFERRGVAPGWLLGCPFGRGRVPELDDLAQRQRRALWLSVRSPGSVLRARRLFREEWGWGALRWEDQGPVVLYEELHPLLTRVACAWAGIPLPEVDVATRAKDFVALFDAPGALGWRHLEARLARRRIDAWLGRLVRDVRGGAAVEPSSVLERLAHARLGDAAAAAELRNLIRSTVALSAYIVCLALALHHHPEAAPKTANQRTPFIQEVRRYYPFFPVVVGRVRRTFEWRGTRFPAGRRAFLDFHGTNRDARTWTLPDEFLPGRFANSPPRAGEELSLAILDEALLQLTGCMTYSVPPQDLLLDMKRLPALPRSGLVLDQVRLSEMDESSARRFSGATETMSRKLA